MGRLRIIWQVCTAFVAVLAPSPGYAQNWYAVEVHEVDDIYPVEIGKVAGDDTSVSYAFIPPAGIEAWSRATRPQESQARNQLSTAFDVRYRVEWYDTGGFSSPILVQSQVAARAHVFDGTSAILGQGGGDFGASAITGDASQNATTGAHAAPYDHQPTPVSILQLVTDSGTVTCRVTLHPTAGLTKPGSFKGYGIATWWLVE